MSYVKTTWVDGETPINATNMNKMESGIEALDTGKEPTITKNTAFNQNFETSTSNIKMNGVVSVGTSPNVARADHVHPSDTIKANQADLNITNENVTTNTTNITTNTNNIALHLADNAYATDAGIANAYVITLNPEPTSYKLGQMYSFKAVNASTSTSTLNVNGLGVKTIKKNSSSDLSIGDIIANQIVSVIYDGINFQLISGGKIVSNRASSLSANGYRYNDDGIIEQWGSVGLSSGGLLTFPLAFPNAVYAMSLIPVTTTPCKVAHGASTLSNVNIYHDAGAAITVEYKIIGR